MRHQVWVELLGRYSKIAPPLVLTAPSPRERPRRAPGRVHVARKRLGPNVIRQLVHDYEAGESATALMRSYGLGKGTVLAILEEQGVQMRGQGLSVDKLPEAAQLYRQGWSLKRVGAHYGCSADTVRVALNGAGVPLRAPWERLTRS